MSRPRQMVFLCWTLSVIVWNVTFLVIAAVPLVCINTIKLGTGWGQGACSEAGGTVCQALHSQDRGGN